MKLEEAKQRLRQRYIDGARTKILVLEESLALGVGHEETEATIRRLAHQIRGTAASYGFAALGELAEATELAAIGDLESSARKLIGGLRGIAAISRAARILVVEDDHDCFEMLDSALASEQQSLHQVTSLAEAEQFLDSEDWDLIILDLVLPDGDGRTLLSRIRAHESARTTPVIVVSAKTNSLVRNECSVYGIEGYLEKPLNMQGLAPLVASCVSRHRTMQREAHVDDLTQIDNRHGFRLRFSKARALCRRYEKPLALALIDLDHFKALNDDFGHDTGDHALRVVARCLNNQLRESDLIGRWGGEEFVVALPCTDAAGAKVALAKANAFLAALPLDDSYPRTVTFSGGICEVGAEQTLEAALHEADRRLYIAKATGRNRVVDHERCEGQEQRPSLLVVEDDHDLAIVLQEDLRKHYAVTHVDSAESALELAAETTYDLVLTDHDLPGISGVELTGALRANPSYSNRPVLVMTANGAEDLIERAFVAGASDYVSKPYRKAELLARLARYLKV